MRKIFSFTLYDNDFKKQFNKQCTRIDICETHTIIYWLAMNVKILDQVSFHTTIPFTLKSVTFVGDTITVHWLNNFYAIIDNA